MKKTIKDTNTRKSRSKLRIGKLKKNKRLSTDEIKSEIQRVQTNSIFNKTLRSTIYILIIVAAVAVLVATLFFPVLQITGNSMEPTLYQGDFVILTKINEFKTGDLCAFYWRNKVLVKRVIGLPGDTINIDFEGNVYINNEIIDEPYISQKSLGNVDIQFPFQVQENQYFVLGDHRDTSMDSRVVEIGCIDKDRMIGKLLIRIWPLNQIKYMSYENK